MIETVTVMTDDLDGKTKTNVATHTIMIDGVWYEIELGTINLGKLSKALSEFIPHARRAPAPGPVKGKAKANGHVRKPDNGAVRAWAAAEGITVKARGRIPAEVMDQFHAATQTA